MRENQQNNYSNQTEISPLMTAGVFLGLVVLAAIICAILWSFTHRDNENEQPVNVTETVQDATVETESESLQSESPETEVVEDETASEQEPISGSEDMEFTEVADTVTAKDVTNLRSMPSTVDSENVVTQLLNGESIARTGVNDAAGWSRLDYNGQTVYAVTRYLTTDLNYKTPVAPGNPNRITTQDGRQIIFTDCDDNVMAKEFVNLRTEPSTSQGESTVRCKIRHGELVHRTGYSPDSGWSRVEYNGEVLYVVSSMIYSSDTTTE